MTRKYLTHHAEVYLFVHSHIKIMTIEMYKW
jgi:hypothetical protein